MIITREALVGEKVVTVTVVHAPRNICGCFRIRAAWDTGDCHQFFGPQFSGPNLVAMSKQEKLQ